MAAFDPATYLEEILKPALEAFLADGTLPDHFARYQLSTDVNDPHEIERAIDEARSYWNRQKHNPSYRQMLGVLLDPEELKKSRVALLDPTQRLIERAAAETTRRERTAATVRELDSFIRIIAVKGYRTPEETRRIVDRFRARGMAEDDIEARFKVPLREPDERTTLDEGLPTPVRDQIRKNLAVFCCRTLHDFLGVLPDADPQELDEAHKEKAAFWSRKAPTDARAAAQQLLGLVKTYLLQENGDRYRMALQWERQEGLRSRVEVAAADRRIERVEFAELMRWALQEGMEQSWARDHILALAHSMGAHVEWADEAYVVCGNCSTASRSEAGVDHCSHCGDPLRIPCPRCGLPMATSLAACPACGHHFRTYVRLRSLTPLLAQALQQGDLLSATDLVEQCRGLAPHGNEVARLAHAFEARRGSLDLLRRTVEEGLSTRLRAASERLRALAASAPGYVGLDGRTLADLEATLLQREERFRSILARAMQLLEDGLEDEAWTEFNRCAEMDVDATEPPVRMAWCRPRPVPRVTLTLQDGGILVEWSPSPSPGAITYEVTRVAGASQSETAPGEILTRTDRHDHADRDVRTGERYSYRVTALRSGCASTPTPSTGTLVVLREVSDCTIEAGDHVVQGSWSVPDGACIVTVHRHEAEEAADAAGRLIPTPGLHGFVDPTVENGVSYRYRIQVAYSDDAGTSLTHGLTVVALPEEFPRPLTSLSALVEEGRVVLSWEPPPRGEVRVHRSPGEPRWEEGDAIPLHDLPTLPPEMDALRSGAAVDPAPLAGVSHYFPVTVLGPRAVAGRAVRVANLEDVRNLEVEDFGSYLQLRWRWPGYCTVARVAWCTADHPSGPEDPEATVVDVSRGEYENRGGFRIQAPGLHPHRVTVYAAAALGQELVFASGRREDCRAACRHVVPTKVHYHIRRRPLSRDLTISLHADHGGEVPEVIVVASPGTVQPLSRTDGRLVARCTGITSGDRPRAWPLELAGTRFPVYVRAFFATDDAYHRFALVDPPVKELLHR